MDQAGRLEGSTEGAAADGWDEARSVRLVSDDKVIAGREGWLFLARDANDVLAQHSGELRLDEEALEHWRAVLEGRIEFLGRLGIPYFFLVAPDTHGVYPEKLPRRFEPAEERPVHQLIRHLADRRSPAQVIYPLDEMLAAKQGGLVCGPVDTHWTQYGAFVAYSRLMDEIEPAVPARRIREQDLSFVEADVHGDLGFKVGGRGPTAAAQMQQFALVASDNQVKNSGAYVVTECAKAPPTTCMLFADSYATALVPFMSESFGRLALINSPTLDREKIDRERPDVVVSLMAERFLIVVADDHNAPSLADRERAALENGRVRPKLTLWGTRQPGSEAATSIEVELIRADLLAGDRLQEATLVSALAYAGLRAREALSLTWPSVSEGAIEIGPLPVSNRGEAIRKEQGSGKRRTVRLLPPLSEDLERWRRACGSPSDGPVFRSADGSRWSRDEWRSWARAMYGATGASPHHLRLTFGALLLREGVPWPEVASEMGHDPEHLPEPYHGVPNRNDSRPLPAEEQIRLARAAVLNGRPRR